MENLSYDALVELITKEVMKLLSESGIASVDSNGNVDKRPLALVIGDKENLPDYAGEKYRLTGIESYEGDITPYDCVFAAKLTLSELSDCALGKDCGKVSCAVSNAFLNGKKVCILESGLPHKKFSETADRKFYAMLEGYVNTLRSFGAEIIREQWYGKQINVHALPDNTADKVITEQIALRLCEDKAGGIIKLRKGTVITPSAKDIFNHSETTVEFVD